MTPKAQKNGISAFFNKKILKNYYKIISKTLAISKHISYNEQDKLEECPMFLRSERTSMGPKRTIGARFPMSCSARRGRSRPFRNVRQNAQLPGVFCAAHGRNACLSAVPQRVRTVPQRGITQRRRRNARGVLTHGSDGVCRFCKACQSVGKMPETCPKKFVHRLAFPKM